MARDREIKTEMPRQNNRVLLIAIVVAIFAGFLAGGLAPGVAVGFKLLGTLFMNLLMMIVVPLVMLSMLVGITSLGNIKKVGAVGGRTILYYFLTTAISVLTGIILVNIIQPGKTVTPGEIHEKMSYRISGHDSRTVMLINGHLSRSGYGSGYQLVLPDQNLRGAIESAGKDNIRVKYWERDDRKEHVILNSSTGRSVPFDLRNGELVAGKINPDGRGRGIEIRLPAPETLTTGERDGILTTLKQVLAGNREKGREGLVPRNIFNAMVRMDILPLIFFSILLGMALSVMGESAAGTVAIISTLNDAVLKIVDWIMVVSPVGIFGIIAARIGEAGGFSGFMPELLAVGRYSLTVVAGLALHGVVFLPLILFFFGRRRPLPFVSGVAPALLNAFSTASSSATLPLTMETVEKENGVSRKTAGFVLPIGATINMDGTALYEAVAALFIAQVYGIQTGPAGQAVIFITATLAAIGAAGIPHAGLVTMVIVLQAAGLPVEGVGIILTVDWILDRFRTTVNVWGDSVGAGVIDWYENRGG